MADRVVLSVGTKRGLFLFESDRRREKWSLRGPLLSGWSVYHAFVDTRSTPRIHAAGVSETFATNTFSGDLRKGKLGGAKKPPVPPKAPPSVVKFAKKYSISLAPRVWHVEPGPGDEKRVLYAGTAPAGLFRSEDGGRTWRELSALSRHSTRRKWFPGAGGLTCHSIQVDPRDRDRIYAGISAAGAFRSDDGGDSWTPINRGVRSFEGGVITSGAGT